jgi:hypothetical protein
LAIPKEITVGDSLTWYDEAFRDNLGNAILPSEWAMSYLFRGPSELDITATIVDGKWKFTITKVQSADFSAGTYYWQARATKGSDSVTFGSGSIAVNASYADAATGFDGRSQVEKDLAAVQAAMRAMISGGAVAEYTIGGRSVRKMTLESLITMESKLKYDLAIERRNNGGVNRHTMKVRFS